MSFRDVGKAEFQLRWRGAAADRCRAGVLGPATGCTRSARGDVCVGKKDATYLLVLSSTMRW